MSPCNYHLRDVAEHVKEGVRRAGGVPLEFGTINVNDGIAMGHEGMKASLVSREVIADSIELMAHGYRLDGLVVLRQDDSGRHDGHRSTEHPRRAAVRWDDHAG
jgi:dihydroxy-acid dehydratase